MKKLFSMVVLLLFLVSCSTGGQSNIPESGNSSIGQSLPAESISSDFLTIYYPLLNLVGAQNKKLKEMYPGECEVSENPNINIDYENPRISFGLSLYSDETDVETGTMYKENPFPDEVIVESFLLFDDRSDFWEKNYIQTNIKRLFVTEKIITYDFLCENLKQYPELVQEPQPEIGDSWGDYIVLYMIDNVKVYVNFTLLDDEYFAVSIYGGKHPYA